MSTYSIQGVVVDKNGKPIEGAIIMIVEGSSPFQEIAATSNENGEFLLDNIQNGTYVLQINFSEKTLKNAIQISGKDIKTKVSIE